MINVFKKLSLILSDYQLAILMFIFKHRYFPNFKNPRSLSEKINYIKLYNRNPLRKTVVDRLKVRDYVIKKAPELSLPNILWHGHHFDEKTWISLPDKFAIKANHGSKMTKIVNKKQDYWYDVKSITEQWLLKDYSKLGREWIYADLEKYLIVEELLTFKNEVPPDFKFFVFQGKVELIQVDLDRFKKHRRNLFTPAFEKMNALLAYPDSEVSVPKPKLLDKAIGFSEAIGKDFDFIRVDLYLLKEKIVFGELTNTPENGFAKFTPRSLDFELGEKLPLKIDR